MSLFGSICECIKLSSVLWMNDVVSSDERSRAISCSFWARKMFATWRSSDSSA